VHQLIVCEYFVHPETDAVAIVAVEEAGVGDKSVTGGLESMTEATKIHMNLLALCSYHFNLKNIYSLYSYHITETDREIDLVFKLRKLDKWDRIIQ